MKKDIQIEDAIVRKRIQGIQTLKPQLPFHCWSKWMNVVTGVADIGRILAVISVVGLLVYCLWPLFCACQVNMDKVTQVGAPPLKISGSVLAFLGSDLVLVCILSLLVRWFMASKGMATVRFCMAIASNSLAVSVLAALVVLWQVAVDFGVVVLLFVACLAAGAGLVFFSGLLRAPRKVV